jgi:hypothetical protein
MGEPNLWARAGGQLKKLGAVAVALWVVVLCPREACSEVTSVSYGQLNGAAPDALWLVREQNDFGLTTSADIVGNDPTPEFKTTGSSTRARTAAATMGLSATSGAGTLGALARTSTADAWSPAGGGSSGSIPASLHVKFDGILDPLLVNPALPALENITMSVDYQHRVGNHSFSFSAGYSAFGGSGSISPMRARLHRLGDQFTTDFSHLLVLEGNRVSFDHTFELQIGGASGWVEQISAGIDITPFDRNVSAHTIDFYSTFTTDLFSNAPNVTLSSEGGRTAAVVPEPMATMMLIPMLAALRSRRRR